MVNLDNTIHNVALPTLARKLGATSSGLQWIVDACALVFAGLLLVGGSLADRYGRKRLFLAGLTVFACGSIGAAFSNSVAMLIGWRAVMGGGAAMTMPATLSIINDLFRDPGERSRAIGLWAGTSGVGIAIGPIAGGLLLAHFWWGSVFLVNVPIVIAGAVAAVALVPDSKDPKARRPDPVGAVLSTLGLGSVLWAIIEAPTSGWLSTEVIAAGAVGLAVIAVFLAWEAHSTHPMLNLGFFRAHRFSAASASLSLGRNWGAGRLHHLSVVHADLHSVCGADPDWRLRLEAGVSTTSQSTKPETERQRGSGLPGRGIRPSSRPSPTSRRSRRSIPRMSARCWPRQQLRTLSN
jgi:MFS family permease